MSQKRSNVFQSVGRGWQTAAPWLLPVGGVLLALALLPFAAENYDMRVYFLPWMESVRTGGLSSISAEFADYTPPYVYLMYLASWLVPFTGPVAAVKLINAPFVGLAAAAVYKIVLQSDAEKSSAVVAAAAVCIAPTILVNAFLWGQADSIFGSFAALFVLFAMRRSPGLAAAMFGLALSFKLQTIFLSPLLLYLLLSRQMKFWHFLIVPIVFILMMTPAAIAGRPWSELAGVYSGQIQSLPYLSVFAPNPWSVIQRLNLLGQDTGLAIGTIVAGAAGLGLAIVSLRLEKGPTTTLLVAVLCSALMPYLLPKMHERYFFVADLLTIALAFAAPSLWLAAVLFQIGSLLAYTSYFGGSGGYIYGILPVTAALLILLQAYFQRVRREQNDRCSGCNHVEGPFRAAAKRVFKCSRK